MADPIYILYPIPMMNTIVTITVYLLHNLNLSYSRSCHTVAGIFSMSNILPLLV